MRKLLLVCMIGLLMSGCANQATDDASPLERDQDRRVRVQQTIPSKTEIRHDENVSDRLEQLAKAVPNVRDATCVVIGNTAVVGIDVEGDMDRAHVGTVKYSVAETLSKDPYGLYAIVTADLDIRNRLLEISRDIRAGRPLSGFAEEMADIIGRVMPQLPRHVAPMQDEQEAPNDRDRESLKNKSLAQ